MRAPGFLLFVVGLASLSLAAEAGVDAFSYTVRPGDTLIGVRDRLLRPGISWQDLQRLNRVADPLRLRPGSRLQGPSDWLRERLVEAQLLQMQGQVTLLRGGHAVPLQVGDSLREGDRLLSGANGSAVLQFADGSRSRLRAGSELDLLRLRIESNSGRTQLGLRSGAVDSKVKPASSARQPPNRFEVRTPVAQLGVRGTEFRSRFENGSTLLEVLEGEVQARLGKAKPDAVAAGLGWRSDASGAQPLPAAPLLQPVPQPIERLPLRLQWQAKADAQAWRLQIEDGSGQVLLDTLLDQPNWQGGALLPDGELQLRLRARNAQGLEGADAQQRVQLRARPEPPLLESPAAQAVESGETVRFAWTRAPEAARYHWQLAANADFSQPIQDQAAVGATELRVTVPLGEHHWRVASVRADGHRGPWSDAQTLSRIPPPPPPAAPPPAQSEAQGDSLSLRWAPSIQAGERYEVQASRHSDFRELWFEGQVERPEVRLQPTQSGPHFVRIRTLAADGRAGPWGGTQAFDWSAARWWWWLAPLLLLAL